MGSLSTLVGIGALRTRVPVRASAPLFEPLVQVGDLRVAGVEELEDVGVSQQLRAVSQAQHPLCTQAGSMGGRSANTSNGAPVFNDNGGQGSEKDHAKDRRNSGNLFHQPVKG